MFRVMKVASFALAGALALAACGNDDGGGGTSASGSPSATKVGIKVGLAYDIGGRGDQSFNDAAAAGLDKAKTDFGIVATELEAAQGETDAQKEERLRLLATDGNKLIIGVGFAYATSLKKVAAEFPATSFALVDDSSFTAANVANLVFAENEGSFLVGVVAALKSKTGNVGFIGGVNTPLIQKFEAGYKAGVEAGKAGTKVQSKYLTQPPDFSGFGDPAKGKVAAEGMYQGGADVIYAAAGGSGGGVFEAAKAAGTKAIGVDSDQYKTADPTVKDVIITSMLKKVDVAVFEAVKAANAGSPLSGIKLFDLKGGGIDYSTSGGFVDDIKAQVDAFKTKIISGEIKVPEK